MKLESSQGNSRRLKSNTSNAAPRRIFKTDAIWDGVEVRLVALYIVVQK